MLISAVVHFWPSTDHDVHLIISSANSPGHGLTVGSDVVMRGVVVGKVVAIDESEQGTRVEMGLQSDAANQITTTATFAYAPSNYFGITSVDVSPGKAGRMIRSGETLVQRRVEDASVGALIASAGDMTGVFASGRVDAAIDRAVVYAQAMVPIMRSYYLLGGIRSELRTGSLSADLRTAGSMASVLPGVIQDYLDAQLVLARSKMIGPVTDEFAPIDATMRLIATGFFGPVGKVLGSHQSDFTPSTTMGAAAAATGAQYLRAVGGADGMRSLTSRLEAAFSGPAGDRRLHVVLQQLPAVASVVGPGQRPGETR
ncbi:MAG TPA: MlaD family protein [Vicinamibacterales bacterium]|nr:MlaD family protein [Vicinamibacterales bacterium]